LDLLNVLLDILWLGIRDGGHKLVAWLKNVDLVRKRIARTNLAVWVVGEHNFDFDAKNA
jgi:hypothetical protein